MKLWHLTQESVQGCDTYSDCVVTAETEEDARKVLPSEGAHQGASWDSWPAPEFVSATLIGECVENLESGQVICASFHAG